MELSLKSGAREDVERIVGFLEKAGLGTAGIDEETMEHFLIAEDEGEIKACLGIELFGDSGLLRSLALSEGLGGHKLFMLFEQMLVFAKKRGLKAVYLATNKRTAIPFFEMVGFGMIVKSELPEEFFRSSHVMDILNVENSVFLKFTI
ncbi:hypothetical protein DRW41_06445 [Neobacillus piezotolerans]|uniref:N-acetyltransferase domain-containing protein n=1 Tax=Neobacillus piezotolerans TaxID=2259171 RepID=A0A3D8GT39_9BACI|nr:GNAT family N-acetyltransferase [Neobacillus piezotolerans]RDU37482.1 hypothetical protein DRW41_06445 [Neobacillus piezotolerans]